MSATLSTLPAGYWKPLFLPNEFCKEAKTIAYVGSGQRVLEVGCANGRMSRLLVRQGCQVTGVEMDPDLSRAANEHCHSVITASIESDTVLEGQGHFDVILMADVLEHLAWPDKVLERLREHLAPGGKLVLAVPNVAFWTMRTRLLFGRFDYSPAGGLLDQTHLRFFTHRSLIRLLNRTGFAVDEFYPAPFLLRGERLSRIRFSRTPLWLLNGLIPAMLSRLMPGLLAYSFVIKARPLPPHDKRS